MRTVILTQKGSVSQAVLLIMIPLVNVGTNLLVTIVQLRETIFLPLASSFIFNQLPSGIQNICNRQWKFQIHLKNLNE